MKGQPRISSIYGRGQQDDPTGSIAKESQERAKKEAWHKFGLLVVDPEDINDDWSRQALINIGDQQYGKRKGQQK